MKCPIVYRRPRARIAARFYMLTARLSNDAAEAGVVDAAVVLSGTSGKSLTLMRQKRLRATGIGLRASHAGIAPKSLRNRLTSGDLNARSAAAFFRHGPRPEARSPRPVLSHRAKPRSSRPHVVHRAMVSVITDTEWRGNGTEKR